MVIFNENIAFQLLRVTFVLALKIYSGGKTLQEL